MSTANSLLTRTAPAARPMHTWLPPGLRVRQGTAADVDALTEFYRSLDSTSRYHRFLQATPTVPTSLARHVLQAPNHVILAVCPDDRVVAEAVLGWSSREAAAPEVAYSVGAGCRRVGLATAMVQRLLAVAAASGFEMVTADIAYDNRGSLRLVAGLGAHVRPYDGHAFAEIPVVAPSAALAA